MDCYGPGLALNPLPRPGVFVEFFTADFDGGIRRGNLKLGAEKVGQSMANFLPGRFSVTFGCDCAGFIIGIADGAKGNFSGVGFWPDFDVLEQPGGIAHGNNEHAFGEWIQCAGVPNFFHPGYFSDLGDYVV